jgi:hypothetical protein
MFLTQGCHHNHCAWWCVVGAFGSDSELQEENFMCESAPDMWAEAVLAMS